MSDDRQARERELADLLDYLHRTRGLDLSGYKRVGLLRRLTKRMRTVGVEGFGEYVRYLETHPTEFPGLLDTLLINVTAFFRDDLPWVFLRTKIVPQIVAQKESTEAIRVWCAGCASGEEAYTLAIVLAEAMGIEAFQERVKLYATDLDRDALAKARLGAYTERDLADVSPELVEKYFQRRNHQFVFRMDLRRCVIFGRNDLMQDAPISRVDLLACRNTLMYFDGPTQAKILARFRFALNEGGFLLLGRAETMLTHGNMFTPVDLKWRIFTKVRGFASGERHVLTARVPMPRNSADAEASEMSRRLRSFDSGMVPQFVIDDVGRLSLVNARARALFRLTGTDVGCPLQDLEVSYRPYELRSVIEQAYTDRQAVVREGIAWRVSDGEPRWFDIVVVPLLDPNDAPAGASVSFMDVTRIRLLQQRLDDSQVELETAYRELQSTNEELETTNEELCSTVEELETMNEELQSTNEELQTINDELRQRSDSLNEVNEFLESMFTSLRAGVAVLDRDLRVTLWNRQAEQLWGMRAEQVEQAPFLSLDIGLPVAALTQPLHACLAGTVESHESLLSAVDCCGRAIVCKTTLHPLLARGSDLPRGVIVIMDEQREAASARGDGDGAAPTGEGETRAGES